jgi:3-isopropylmalate dehydrogenase
MLLSNRSAISGQRVASAAAPCRARMASRSISSRVQTVCKVHKICILPGDGIGPEIMAVATKVLSAAGRKEGAEFEYKYELIGGAAIDATGQPLPDQTLVTAKASDSVLLAAIGGYAG